MAGVVTGDRQLKKELEKLQQRATKKASRTAVTKSSRIIAKSVKAHVPSKYRQFKKLIGSRLLKINETKNPSIIAGKVGFAVGMSVKRKKQVIAKNAERREKASSKKGTKKRGVGISAQNIHWAVLGTEARTTKSGKSTGRMPAILKDVVSRGYEAAGPAVGQQLLKTIRVEIYRPLKK